MGGVYEARVRGTDRRTGREETRTYTVDVGPYGGTSEGESRAKHKARHEAYGDGLSPQYVSVSRSSDHGKCPHCGEPVTPESLK